MTKLFLRLAAVALALVGASATVMADDALTLTNPFNYRSNIGQNVYGFPAGDWQYVGVTVSYSDLPTTVTAAQNGTVLTLGFVPAPIRGNSYEIVFPFDPALTGPWTITAVRGIETVSIVTPGLPAPILVPQLEDLRVENPNAEPALTWIWPDLGAAQADGLALAFRIVAIDDHHRDEFELNFGFTEHPIVVGRPGEGHSILIPPGELETGALFSFRVIVSMLDRDGNLLSRSVTFARNLFTAI